jgi:Zn-dependent peptidase ImmA (M78 family)
MERLCASLALHRSYFLHKSNERVGTLFFRSVASATQTERRKQHHRQKWRRRVLAFLRQYVDFPAVRVPHLYEGDPNDLSLEVVDRLAGETRSWLGLRDGPISDVTLLVENHGAIVVRTTFDCRSLDAFSEWGPDDATPYFVLNSDKRSAVRSRFDLCHELGHMVLHRHVLSLCHSETFKLLEQQAHRFAGAFLAPASTFTRSYVVGSLEALIELKQFWGLSVQAIARRAHDLGLVSESTYRRIMTELSKRGWRTREPLDDNTLPEEPRLLRRCIDLLLRERILDQRRLTQLAAGSLRDIETCLGLPLGYLDEPTTLRFPEVAPQTDAQPRTKGRIIPMPRFSPRRS